MDLTIYWTEFAENQLQNIFEYYYEKANYRTAKKLTDDIYDATLILKKSSKYWSDRRIAQRSRINFPLFGLQEL